ncbi:MAG: hypothetical protein GC136_07035 [Alphaproteobacteria bacterium]|nr:hypothetical protein [Alphaproteobacteria bacterium]
MTIALMLDIAIALMLGCAIFYAVRLRSILKTIQDGKDDLKQLVAVLGQQIAGAQNAIGQLQNTADNAVEDLQGKLVRARELSDELNLMNEAADSYASRLEKLASKNREIMEGMETARLQSTGARNLKPGAGEEVAGLFQIRDPDFIEDVADEEDEVVPAKPAPTFQSEAEKKLAAFLQGRKGTL